MTLFVQVSATLLGLLFFLWVVYVFLCIATRIGEWGHGCVACKDGRPVCWVDVGTGTHATEYRQLSSILPKHSITLYFVPQERLCNRHWRQWERITKLEEEVFDE